MRLTYLFTSFPVATETFLQREVRAMRELGVDLELHSLWGGADAFEGLPIRRLRAADWCRLPGALGYWLLRKPEVLNELLRHTQRRGVPSGINLLETGLGIAFALLRAREFERHRPEWLHAVWAGGPATAAWLLHRLLDLPYSTGAHAYDLFEDGGDWLLEPKLAAAALVHCSTEAARAEALARGARPDRTQCIRRGLEPFPAPRDPAQRPARPHLLTIGRLVEKMGHGRFLETCARLKANGVDFTAEIIGGGPLESVLRRQCRALGLEDRVTFAGALPYPATEARLRRAHVLLFCGAVARSGDRAGFPNVLGEALALGVPVVASPVGGVAEGVRDGATGLIARDPREFAAAVQRILGEPSLASSLSTAGRAWAEREFQARPNAARLRQAIAQAAGLL